MIDASMTDPAVIETSPSAGTPDPIHNCPGGSLWLPPMTLACPECHTIVYAAYLTGLGQLAMSQEQERAWPQARETWQRMLQWLPAGEQSQKVAAHLATIDERI